MPLAKKYDKRRGRVYEARKKRALMKPKPRRYLALNGYPKSKVVSFDG